MKWFLLLLAVEYPLCLCVEIIRSGRTETLKRIRSTNIHLLIAAVACAALVLFSGLRYEYFADAIVYTPNFESFNYSSFKEIWNSYDYSVSGDGFYLMSKLFKFYISDNIHVYYTFCAAICIVPVFICFYRTSEALEYSVTIYILFGAYILTTTAIKQTSAVGLMFMIFPLIYKRKWYLYIPLVLLFSQFHKSALIFIPIYFLASVKHEKLKEYMPFIVIFFGMILAVTYPVSGPIMAKLIGESNAEAEATSGGSSPIRIIIALIPVLLGWFFRDRIRPRAKYFDIVMIMSSFCVVWYSISLFYWIYARFSIFFVPYSIVLICYIVKYGFPEKQKKFWYFLILALFFVYFIYDTVTGLTLGNWFYWYNQRDNPFWYIDKYDYM